MPAPRLHAPVVLGCYLLATLVLGYLSLAPDRISPPWVMALLFVGGLGSLALWRRSPALAFIASLALWLVSMRWGSLAEAVLVLGALHRTGATQPARRAWLWLALTLVASPVAAAGVAERLSHGPSLWGATPPQGPRDWVTDWANLVFFCAVFAVIAALAGVLVGHRRRLVASLELRAEQLRRERDQQADIATARERERIAREMHDVIAHSLAVMIAMADGAHASAVRRPEESREAIGRVAVTGRRTLGEVRRLLGSVRGDDDGDAELPQPGAGDLPALVEEFRSAGLPVSLQVTGVPADADDAVLGLTVYRIVQESLTNVLRHARGVRDVAVRVVHDPTGVTIGIEDASDTAAPASDPGRGLVGIRERASFYDGTVETGPRDGGGWRTIVRLVVKN